MYEIEELMEIKGVKKKDIESSLKALNIKFNNSQN